MNWCSWREGYHPMELLIDDQSVSLPLPTSKVAPQFHTGQWEGFQDWVLSGSGENLSAEIADRQTWSHVLTPGDIYSLIPHPPITEGDYLHYLGVLEVKLAILKLLATLHIRNPQEIKALSHDQVDKAWSHDQAVT
ncbi:hypothetical protein NHX12_001575 [Muraenolepis orangiensis]|uniref:Uncharacterized protein n=1 Tax=Muraenolepis orangiensis TaxID=630683 RepID=A0A9Q0IIB2_9TELE|nr:hypothetical protein NHX12_001575 [Muraenolepis orangiensis]